MKVAFLHKGNSLIYIALSKVKDESVSFMRKQLEMLHCQLISIATQSVIKAIKKNPSFDVVNDIYHSTGLLKTMCHTADKDPATFLNAFLPLRMHIKTKEAIE
jgi:hypothetical protein